MSTESDISKISNPYQTSSSNFLVLLKLVAGGEAKTYRLDKDRIVIGSVVSADVRIVGEGIAPIHAVIENYNNNISLYDLASESGVFVNGQKALTHKLKEGDTITIGHFKLEFNTEPFKGYEPFAEDRARSLNPNEDFSPLLVEDRPIEDIFDYRLSSKSALEIIMSWNDTVIEMYHFVDQSEVTLGGTKQDDFAIPSLLSKDPFVLATRTGNGYVIKLDPKMRGVMQRQGQLRNLAGSDTGQQIQMEKSDFAKIVIGDIDFYLSFTAAPPKLKPAKYWQRDALFLKLILSSLLFTAVLITALIRAQPPQAVEAEQLPERIATILYQPEKYAYVPPAPKPEVPQPKAPEPTPVAKVEPPKPKPTIKVTVTPQPVKTPKPIPKEMTVAKQKTPEKKYPPRIRLSKKLAVTPKIKPKKGKARARKAKKERAELKTRRKVRLTKIKLLVHHPMGVKAEEVATVRLWMKGMSIF